MSIYLLWNLVEGTSTHILICVMEKLEFDNIEFIPAKCRIFFDDAIQDWGLVRKLIKESEGIAFCYWWAHKHT